MPAPPVLSVSHLSKKFARDLRRSLRYGVRDVIGELVLRRSVPGLRAGEFWALDDVSFTLAPGEALAIVGGNGAGKSTLLKLLSGLLKPDKGEVRIQGRAGALIELGTGINPILTGRENVTFSARMYDLTASERTDFEERAVAFADLGEFIDAPVQSLSAGMRARLGYAIAAQLEPTVLLVDEVLAVGDLAFQHKCAQHIASYLKRGGALLFVSHNAHQIQSLCQRGLLLDHGRPVFSGTAVETLNEMFERRLLAPPVETCSFTAVDAIRIEAMLAEPVAAPEIRVGQSVRIRLSYRSRTHTQVTWGFTVWTGDGWTHVIGEHDPTVHAIAPGPGELTCVIPRLPLVGGRYALRGVLLDGETRQPLAMSGRGHAGGILDVRSDPHATHNMRRATGQLVMLDVNWE